MDATPPPPTVDAAFVQLRELQELITAHAIQLADRIASKAVRKYSWLCADDLRQELVIPLPRWIARFNPKDKSGTTWSKYLYHKMNFYLKDVLRREDPVGIKWPQREQYPTWFRLGDQSSRLSAGDGAGTDDSGGCGSDCPSDLLGKTLEIAVELTGDEDEQIWQSSLTGLASLAKQNRKRKQFPLLVDAGSGVARSAKCVYWDSGLSRVRFSAKKVVTLASWIGHSRSQLTLW